MSHTEKNQAIADYQTAYAASDFEVIQAQYRKRLLLDLLAEQKPKCVLEVGCGLSTIANFWQGFESLCIVEPGHQFAEKARLDTKHQPKARVVEAFMEDATDTLSNETYDLILLSSLLHEVPDAGALLLSAKKLCAPNTLVHINVPNAKSMHRLLALEMGLIDSVHAQSALQKTFNQPRIFDLDSLKNLAVRTGFQVVSAGSFFMKPFTHGQMHSLAMQGLMTPSMLDGLWNLTKHFPENGSEIYINIKL